MKIYSFLFILILTFNFSSFAETDEEIGLKIAKEAYESTRGYIDSTSEQLMILIDPNGNEVIREISGKIFLNWLSCPLLTMIKIFLIPANINIDRG